METKESKKTKIINDISKDVRSRQIVHPLYPAESLENIIEAGMSDIDDVAGTRIDYAEDLSARTLLINYVFYAVNQRLAEFKEVYTSEYTALQIKYY